MGCIEIYLFLTLLWKGAPCSVLSKTSMSQVLKAWDGETSQTSVPMGVERSRGSSLSPAPEVWLYGSLPMKWRQQRDGSWCVGQSGLGERNIAVAYFSAEKFESKPNPPGFPWTHPLLPSGIEGVKKFACCFKDGFLPIFLRSLYVADMQIGHCYDRDQVILTSTWTGLTWKLMQAVPWIHSTCTGLHLMLDSEGTWEQASKHPPLPVLVAPACSTIQAFKTTNLYTWDSIVT